MIPKLEEGKGKASVEAAMVNKIAAETEKKEVPIYLSTCIHTYIHVDTCMHA